jgi:hypothetical protein
MEDVFITGILAEQCKFERQHIEVRNTLPCPNLA